MFLEICVAEADALGPSRVSHPLEEILDSLGSADMDGTEHCYVLLVDWWADCMGRICIRVLRSACVVWLSLCVKRISGIKISNDMSYKRRTGHQA